MANDRANSDENKWTVAISGTYHDEQDEMLHSPWEIKIRKMKGGTRQGKLRRKNVPHDWANLDEKNEFSLFPGGNNNEENEAWQMTGQIPTKTNAMS